MKPKLIYRRTYVVRGSVGHYRAYAHGTVIEEARYRGLGTPNRLCEVWWADTTWAKNHYVVFYTPPSANASHIWRHTLHHRLGKICTTFDSDGNVISKTY